jgi:hypothetical protein
MINKEVAIDKIEALENGVIQVRQVSRIIEDNTELSRSYHRWVLSPGQSITDQDARVQAVCNAVWTPEVIAAYQNSRLGLQ